MLKFKENNENNNNDDEACYNENNNLDNYEKVQFEVIEKIIANYVSNKNSL